jgi:hypothetical protein
MLVLHGTLSSTLLAQSNTGHIKIVVVDSKAQPLRDCRIALSGSALVTGLTDSLGQLQIPDLPVGIYVLQASKSGFLTYTDNKFGVYDRPIFLRITLGASLQTIGRVTATSYSSARTIDDMNPERRLSDSLYDALDKLAGVSVNQLASGSLSVSVRNRETDQTGISIDGIPMGSNGAASLRSIAPDLFSGATVDSQASATTIGGRVNFRTLEPTKESIAYAGASYGSFDRSFYQIAITGSHSKLSFAAQHAFRGTNNPLSGDSYLDTSGLDYVHRGASRQIGDLAKVRFALSPAVSISAEGLTSNSFSDALCTTNAANVPCGYGPRNYTFSHGSFAALGLSTTGEHSTVSLTLFQNRLTQTQDYAQRYVAGTLSPLAGFYALDQSGISTTASVTHGRHESSIQFQSFAGSDHALTTFAPTDVEFVQNLQKTSLLKVRERDKLSDHIVIDYELGIASATGAGSSPTASVGVGWSPMAKLDIKGSASFGSAQPAAGATTTFSSPANAQFDCAGGVTTVSGPGDTAVPQSSASYDLSVRRGFGISSIQVSVYEQIQKGQNIGAFLPIGSLKGASLPPSYLLQLSQNWTLPLNCGIGDPFNPNKVYVFQSAAGTERRYQGIEVAGRIGIGRDLVILPTYSLGEAKLLAADSRFLSPASIYSLGTQLPDKPRERAGVTLDFLARSLHLELLANVQYVGSNNARHLVPYTVLNVGASRDIGSGTLSLVMTNALNAYYAPFASERFSTPYLTEGGGTLPTIATPLAPGQVTLQYSLKLRKPQR